jgi:hypothetical protein
MRIRRVKGKSHAVKKNTRFLRHPEWLMDQTPEKMC